MNELTDLIAALRERTWLSPVSAEEMNQRDRWLADQLEAIGADLTRLREDRDAAVRRADREWYGKLEAAEAEVTRLRDAHQQQEPSPNSLAAAAAVARRAGWDEATLSLGGWIKHREAELTTLRAAQHLLEKVWRAWDGDASQTLWLELMDELEAAVKKATPAPPADRPAHKEKD